MANTINKVKIGGINYDIVGSPIFGISNTSAESVEKIVNIDSEVSFFTGMTISVKFTNANSAEAPKLKINSLDAKPIYYKDKPISSSYLQENHVY